jgi:cysteine desulfurase / selenocysteine lyase
MGLVGLHAAMEMLLEVGVENISSELLRKRAWLVPALTEKGYTVLHAGAPKAHWGGSLTFHRPGGDMAALYARLDGAKITVSLRVDRNGQQYIRLSPHFYNTDAELGRLIELV